MVVAISDINKEDKGIINTRIKKFWFRNMQSSLYDLIPLLEGFLLSRGHPCKDPVCSAASAVLDAKKLDQQATTLEGAHTNRILASIGNLQPSALRIEQRAKGKEQELFRSSLHASAKSELETGSNNNQKGETVCTTTSQDERKEICRPRRTQLLLE